MEICVKVDNQKDGAIYAYYGNVFLGELSEFDPIEYVKHLDAMVKLRRLLGNTNLGKAVNSTIEQMAAKLLAYYATE